MTEERLKEIEARAAAAHIWRLYGGEPSSAYQLAKKDIPDLVAALREAQSLLRALANVGPSVIELRPHEQQWLCCFGPFAFEGIEPVGHKTDCPWLAAKQYLEPPTQ